MTIIYLPFETIPTSERKTQRQNGGHFADDTFEHILLNENVRISIEISLRFVPRGPVHNILALAQIMAWRRPGDKPLSEPMMVRLTAHICVTRSHWVNSCRLGDEWYISGIILGMSSTNERRCPLIGRAHTQNDPCICIANLDHHWFTQWLNHSKRLFDYLNQRWVVIIMKIITDIYHTDLSNFRCSHSKHCFWRYHLWLYCNLCVGRNELRKCFKKQLQLTWNRQKKTNKYINNLRMIYIILFVSCTNNDVYMIYLIHSIINCIFGTF